jgi:PTH1 family peptidyl-tRNA hydrolase
MNESGGPIKALAAFYKVDPAHVIVIHDELDIAFSTIRVKLAGGDNGHNGLKSLTSSFGTSNYYRVRMGVGRPIGQQDPADFVLKQFSVAEKKELSDFLLRGAEAVESLITKGLEVTQQDFNS